MNNVLLDNLPTSWNGYEINTWFQIGIQVFLVSEDKTLSKIERSEIITELLFDDRPHPTGNDLSECIKWFLNGWDHDGKPKKKSDNKNRLVDYDVDQWRIYADFMNVYHIDLSESEMHWWMFNGLLWNLPYMQSSFLNAVEIRKKKITSKMSKEEKESIKTAQEVYGLGTYEEEKKEFTKEEIDKIDAFDEMMKKMKK